MAGELRQPVGVRRFRIAVRNCRGCGREWPAYLETCHECAAALGESRAVECARVVPSSGSEPLAPALAVVIAIELSTRNTSRGDGWAARTWQAVAPSLASALRVSAGPAGTIVAAWPLRRTESLAEAAQLALELRERAARGGRAGAELRGGIAVGVVGGKARTDAVERCAERLALAAAAGGWLVAGEAARTLEDRFVLRPAGVTARWPVSLPESYRALVAELAPPRLPSAVNGEAPKLVLGRERERRRLLAEMATAAAGRRRVILVSAPAGGGKSYLLRGVLADAELTLAAGTAFPPLGSRPLDPLRALLASLGQAHAGHTNDRLGEALARAASRRARTEPAAIVIDDVHWGSSEAVAALAHAIGESAADVPLAWIVSARTAALPTLDALVALADARIDLPPLEPVDRVSLLAARLGAVPDAARGHVAHGAERGNPLYLEHLAEAITEGSAGHALPGTLHEAVLSRLDALVERTRQLTHWWRRSAEAKAELESLERELGDWLDRLETSDVADLATIGRYLARLRAVDVDLVIARSILQMPVAANRRLLWAVERLAAASTDALLDHLGTIANEGRRGQAAYEARAAAERAEQMLRLADAERLLGFAYQNDPGPELARARGDLALARGRPHEALRAYRTAADAGAAGAELERATARAEALLGLVPDAITRLESLLRCLPARPALASGAVLDLARLRGRPGPEERRWPTATLAARARRTRAWARPGDAELVREAVCALALVGKPAACAAELIDAAALSHFAGLEVAGLNDAALEAARLLDNPHGLALLGSADVAQARHIFLHWDA